MKWFIYVGHISVACGYLVSIYGKSSVDNFEDKPPPEDCNFNPREALDSYSTVEDFDRCAPYLLPDRARIYFQGGAGRQWTLRENRIAFERLKLRPKVLRDVSKTDLSVSVLKQRISMPIGAAPVAYQRLASDLGEIDTVRAASAAHTVMCLSSVATTLIEDVAQASFGAILWMQIYIFPNRSISFDLMKRAEDSGFHAIVITVDSPILGSVPIDAGAVLQDNNPRNLSAVNVGPTVTSLDASVTFEDLRWFIRNTRLPVVVKGILTPEDAIEAAMSGAAGIMVSNHGGRQLDYSPAAIDALPNIVDALRRRFPHVEVYMDGGIRNGFDVFKALALGARAVFVGRPIIWGLAAGGQRGVSKVLDILRNELNETMILAGTPNIRSINRRMVMDGRHCENPNNEISSRLYLNSYEYF